jgi:2-polyprenyl-3-methyl-5-hydroxy-6-metoxy-1,4-benzoquinol methylase
MFADLCASLWAISALRVAAETDLLASLVEGAKDGPAIAQATGLDATAATCVLDVLVAYDVVARDDRARFTLTEEGRQLAARGQGLRADLAVTFGATRALVEEARRSDLASGWRHVDPEVIRNQANLSFEMTDRMAGPMIAGFPELAEALGRENARHLDVGVGGAGGAIAMCKHFPKLRVTGIDALRVAHNEAKSAVTAAGLAHRIELRLQRAEEMTDENVFHSCFTASKFFDSKTLAVVLDRVRRALVPGGVIFLGGWRDPGDRKLAAVSRLREHLWGGQAIPAETVAEMLQSAGFESIATGPQQASVVPIVARKPR